jgi:hypothetical protein
MSFIRSLTTPVLIHTSALLLAGVIGAGLAYVLTPTRPGPPPFETTTRDELHKAVRAAKQRIVATSYVLSDIDADVIKAHHDSSPEFAAILVMVDPLGAGGPNRVMCQRQRDEDGDNTTYPNYGRVLNKLRDFYSPGKTKDLIGGKLRIGLIDAYPTMAVLLVDDDLYVYFYPYTGASNSPVIKFQDYTRTREPRGDFFDDYLNKVTGYRNQSAVRKTRFLETDKDWLRYLTADTNQPCTAKPS